MKKTTSAILTIGLLIITTQLSRAGSASWNLNPTSGDWNTAANWTPATVPMVASDVATFGASNTTTITVSDTLEVDSIIFQPGASVYTIGPKPHIVFGASGAGVINNSGVTQHFLPDQTTDLYFAGTASVGSNIEVTIPGTINTSVDGLYGLLQFFDTASAGTGVYTLNGSQARNYPGGRAEFVGSSTAGHGIFTLMGGLISGAPGASATFYDNSSGGNATFTLKGGVVGSNETLLLALIDSTFDGAQLILTGNSTLDISGHNAPGISLGSLEGNGKVRLGYTPHGKPRKLTVGRLGLDMTFSGVIDDLGANGSLTKIGHGRLTLSGANTYLGTTLVSAGQLLVNNATGSGTGTGSVQVNAGTLGGTGTIAGPVTVAISSKRATLAPGRGGSSIGTLTILSPLICNNTATYHCGVNTADATADRLAANGVTINSATFALAAIGTNVISPGTILTVIANNGATAIAGTFANLANGAIVSAGGNNFQASYTGGDGNDLTLTVVP